MLETRRNRCYKFLETWTHNSRKIQKTLNFTKNSCTTHNRIAHNFRLIKATWVRKLISIYHLATNLLVNLNNNNSTRLRLACVWTILSKSSMIINKLKLDRNCKRLWLKAKAIVRPKRTALTIQKVFLSSIIGFSNNMLQRRNHNYNQQNIKHKWNKRLQQANPNSFWIKRKFSISRIKSIEIFQKIHVKFQMRKNN